ncbi:hypothetical protein [Ornithinimicrobium kibberense]|uniref:hypothetical protein n=1 Tax=Ornithinimicrobium kibberense TaxID=282060 RepID=UPI0036096FF2
MCGRAAPGTEAGGAGTPGHLRRDRLGAPPGRGRATSARRPGRGPLADLGLTTADDTRVIHPSCSSRPKAARAREWRWTCWREVEEEPCTRWRC